ncbi:MAG: tetratricopeptide repeat protein, partial [Sphingomonas sp.]
MYQPLRTSSAASLAVLASLITGCVSQEAERGGTMHYAKVNEDAGLATRAMVALGANKVPEAIDLAERAVAKSPDDAGFRALLGNTYFAGGRFRSAESAYKDALTIYSNQPRVVLKLALVQIALGKNDEAIGLLKSARPMVDDSNYGLALALAGHADEAIAVLEPAARRDDADATARQNLALAYALAGDWIKARTIAAQDVPGNQLDGRIHQWMQLANPKAPSDRVAALVGVTPAVVDQGQPVQLALLKSDSRLAAAPAAPVAPVAKPPIVQTALATPAPAPVQAVAPAP